MLKTKKLILLLGDAEQQKAAIDTFGKRAKVINAKESALPYLEEALRVKLNQEFKAPITVGDYHVRHFFGKMQLGIAAVQNFVGKVLKTPDEAVDFFLNVAAKKSFGEDWLQRQVLKKFEDEIEGIFLATEFSLDQALSAKSDLKNNLIIVGLGEDSSGCDYHLESKTKGAIKSLVQTVFTKITTNESRRIANERATA